VWRAGDISIVYSYAKMDCAMKATAKQSIMARARPVYRLCIKDYFSHVPPDIFLLSRKKSLSD
jgi:hypothetical protein